MTTQIFGAGKSPSYNTFTWASEPNKVHNGLTYAIISDGTAQYQWGSSLSGIPADADVSSAFFHLFTSDWEQDAVQVSLKQSADIWDSNSTWNGRPSPTGAAVIVTHDVHAVGVEFTFDVTSVIQAAVASGDFRGFIIKRADAGDERRVFSNKATGPLQPYLVVQYTAAGQKPSHLSPNGYVGDPKPTLSGFPRGTQSVRIQADHSETGFGSPLWQSGTQDVTSPQFRLADSTFPGTLVGATWWWRASVLDATGNWSDYSDPIHFTYQPLPTFSITGPSDDYPYVTDPSPTFTRSDVSGGTATAEHLWVSVADDPKQDPVWNSGLLVGDQIGRSHTMPNGNIDSRQGYRLRWAIYDQFDRVATPGSPNNAVHLQDFMLVDVPGVPPVSAIDVEQVGSTSPLVRVRWFRDAGVPDQFTLWRDDAILVDGMDPGDYSAADGDGWEYIDGPRPGVQHTYYVQAVSNRNSSVPGPLGVITPIVRGHWLYDSTRQSDLGDGPLRVFLVNAKQTTFTTTDQVVISQGTGEPFPVALQTGLSGQAGTIEGTILSLPGDTRSLDDWENDWLAMRNPPLTQVSFATGNKAMPIKLWNMNSAPHPTIPQALVLTANWFQSSRGSRAGGPPPGDPPGFQPPDIVYRYADGGIVDGSALLVGHFDITATAGSPVGETDAIVPGHTDTIGWKGGSITRSVPNEAAFTIDVYFQIPAALPDGSSIITIKNPGASSTPLDVRLRTKGVIDAKMQDNSIVASDHTWQKGQWCRASLRGTWEITPGGADGHLLADVFLYLTENGEGTVPDDVIHIDTTTDAPVHYTHGSPNPSDIVYFEVERVWLSAVNSGPYGTPPPMPPLNPPTTELRLGGAQPDSFQAVAYTGDILGFDVVSLNVSANADMSGASPHAGVAHDTWGMNKWTVTGLSAATTYYAQPVVAGTPHGPIRRIKTTAAVGATGTIKRAVAGCSQSPPASLACFLDMSGANDAFVADYLVHLGDDTYVKVLTEDISSHEISYAQSMCDSWSGLLQGPSLGIGLYKTISDHDCTGGNNNGTNFADPITIASLAAWEKAVPMPMADTRVPRVGRYWSNVERNVRFVFLDSRNVERTDTRKTGVAPDAADSMFLDAVQEAWLYDEATLAATAGQLLIVFSDTSFLGTSPYIDGEGPGGTKGIPVTFTDKWGSYTVQRDRVDETLASIMPISDGHPNVEIWCSDSHALQFGVSPNGIKVRVCGPLDQNLHAHYQDSYDITYPANTKGDDYTGPGGTNTRQAQQYMRMTIAEAVRGTWTVTADMRECSPKVVGDTPVTEHTDSTTYSISGDIVGDHLYSLPGLPT